MLLYPLALPHIGDLNLYPSDIILWRTDILTLNLVNYLLYNNLSIFQTLKKISLIRSQFEYQ